MPQIDFTVEAPAWDPSDRDFSECEGDMTGFRGALVKEVEMERGPKMVMDELSLGTAGIDVMSDENFGLVLEINVNLSNEFTTVAMKNLETHKIMSVGKSSSRRLLAINHKLVQATWVIYPALANNTVESTTQQGFIISCPHPLLTKRIRRNDRILWHN